MDQIGVECSFQSQDGTSLYGRYVETEAAKGNAMLLHGYAEHCGRYSEVLDRLRSAHLNVFTFDFRGHGRSDGDRGYISSFEDYLQDTEAAFTQLEERAGEKPTVLCGHSNGGLVALRFLADPFRLPKNVTCGVLSSPFLRLKLRAPVKAMLGRVASRFMPKLALPNEIQSEQLTSDPVKIDEHRADLLCHDVASARWFAETEVAQAWVLEFAHRVTVPTLWLVAGSDEIADSAHTQTVARRIPEGVEYHALSHMKHEVFNELERETPLRLLHDFVTRQVDG